MKKATLKFVCMVLSVLLLLPVLAACGKTEAGDTFVIGGIGPLTGAAATYGNAVKKGAQLAVDEINAAGGINGVKITLYFEDDEHNEEKAVNAYNTLKDKNAQIILGTVTSKPCIAITPLTKDDNIFQLTPSGSAVDCVKYENAFRVCFYDSYQGAAAADYVKDNNMATEVGVFYESDYDYSVGLYKAFCLEGRHLHRRDTDFHDRHQHRLLGADQRAGSFRSQGHLYPDLCGRSFHIPHPGKGQVRR